MNETAAREWLNKAWHHHTSGQILYEANHYTDTIAVDLHYAVEIILKAFLAYDNQKILKTHNLLEIAELIKKYITFSDDEAILLIIITKYHIKGSYPTANRALPPREEIKEVLDFTDKLFNKVCQILNIDPKEVKK